MNETQYYLILNAARGIAQKAHWGQKRRDGITHYMEHPKAVAARVADDNEAEIVALLHDTMESDAALPITPQQLRDLGIPSKLVDTIQLLTRQDGETYSDYIEAITVDPLAIRVKIADILTNLTDTPTRGEIRRYAEALLVLTAHTK